MIGARLAAMVGRPAFRLRAENLQALLTWKRAASYAFLAGLLYLGTWVYFMLGGPTAEGYFQPTVPLLLILASWLWGRLRDHRGARSRPITGDRSPGDVGSGGQPTPIAVPSDVAWSHPGRAVEAGAR